MSERIIQTSFLMIFVLIFLILAFLAFTKEKSRIRSLFLSLAIAHVLLFFFITVELWVDDLNIKMFLNNVEFVFFTSIPILVFLYELEYSGMRRWVDLRTIVIISVIPMVGLILLWTNDLHHLFFSEVGFISVGDMKEMVFVFGDGFLVQYVYLRMVTVLGTLFMFHLFTSTPKTQRTQVGLVLVASAIPWMITTGEVFFYINQSYMTYYINFAFLSVMAGFLYIGTFMFKHSDVTPMALGTVLEKMQDGVVTIDSEGMIAFANESAYAILGKNKDIIGKRSADEIPLITAYMGSEDNREQRGPAPTTIIGDRSYQLGITEMKETTGTIQGHLIIIRDISEERAAKDALKLANEKLSLLAMVSRHDIMNKMAVLKGYLELARMGNAEETLSKDRVSKMLQAVNEMEKIMIFTREYQKVGMESPDWQDVGSTVKKGASSVNMGMITLSVSTGRAEICADLMLEKVFANLFDNSVRHGGKVTSINIWTDENDVGDLRIYYEDNGIGVPEDEKERIFALGYGKNTGLGLHMSRQILGITGCSIREVGVPGRSCIFEISVPPIKWRTGDISASVRQEDNCADDNDHGTIGAV